MAERQPGGEACIAVTVRRLARGSDECHPREGGDPLVSRYDCMCSILHVGVPPGAGVATRGGSRRERGDITRCSFFQRVRPFDGFRASIFKPPVQYFFASRPVYVSAIADKVNGIHRDGTEQGAESTILLVKKNGQQEPPGRRSCCRRSGRHRSNPGKTRLQHFAEMMTNDCQLNRRSRLYFHKAC
jgi:hypothetical protein